MRIQCSLFLAVLIPALAQGQAPAQRDDEPRVLVVVGAPGEAAYSEAFSKQAAQWGSVCAAAQISHLELGLAHELPAGSGLQVSNLDDRARLVQTLAAEARDGLAPLWLVLIGHGTFDGREARFNLRGADVAATELAEWIKPFTRPLVIINTSSASAPFLAKLAGPNRIVVTATRSGHETNFARFGGFLAECLAATGADLDQDGQTSLLEAFLRASQLTAEFYATEGRLATEHALIDDNGDGLGTPAEWFRGIRAVKKARDNAALDGARAQQSHLVRAATEHDLTPEQRARRDALELEIASLRQSKSEVPEDEYYGKLETLLLELSKIYADAKSRSDTAPPPSPAAK